MRLRLRIKVHESVQQLEADNAQVRSGKFLIGIDTTSVAYGMMLSTLHFYVALHQYFVVCDVDAVNLCFFCIPFNKTVADLQHILLRSLTIKNAKSGMHFKLGIDGYMLLPNQVKHPFTCLSFYGNQY